MPDGNTAALALGRPRPQNPTMATDADALLPARALAHLAVIIPAFNEEEAIGATVAGLHDALTQLGHPFEILVADNGSTDRTAECAREAKAHVVSAPERGYGAACLAAIAALRDECEVVVFADGDGADDPADLGTLIAPILAGKRTSSSARVPSARPCAGTRRTLSPCPNVLAIN